jgi:hypothetical protein
MFSRPVAVSSLSKVSCFERLGGEVFQNYNQTMQRFKTGNITSIYCVLITKEVNDENKRLLTLVKLLK